ncbi:alpha/beta hydrolase [Niallia taxi]|uniref:alpha/beta hydrolase n=1 Tax=Niallia taxi TaxID=2499688 RepID=UPI002E20AA9D
MLSLTACLCIHGFTGAPNEVEPLAEYLLEHTDWECAMPVLPGHGELLQLKGVSFNEWIHCAERALEELLERHEEVYVVGFSMGGMIASYLAARYPVKKLVLLSAAAFYINPKQLRADIINMCRDLYNGKLFENELFNRYSYKIKTTPLSATIQFRKLVRHIKPLLESVTIPTFIAQGDSDGIVPLKSADYLYQTIKAKKKKIVYMKNSKHLICHCKDNQALFSQILNFLS